MNDENKICSTAVVYDKKNPFLSTLKRRVLLNKEGSDKETLHLSCALPAPG